MGPLQRLLKARGLLHAVADGLDLLDATEAESKRVVKAVKKGVKRAKTAGDAVRVVAGAVSDDAIVETANNVGDRVLNFLRHVDGDKQP